MQFLAIVICRGRKSPFFLDTSVTLDTLLKEQKKMAASAVSHSPPHGRTDGRTDGRSRLIATGEVNL